MSFEPAPELVTQSIYKLRTVVDVLFVRISVTAVLNEENSFDSRLLGGGVIYSGAAAQARPATAMATEATTVFVADLDFDVLNSFATTMQPRAELKKVL